MLFVAVELITAPNRIPILKFMKYPSILVIKKNNYTTQNGFNSHQNLSDFEKEETRYATGY